MSSAGASRFWLDAGREAELVIAAQRGDPGAFMELLRSYHGPLWRLAFALTRSEPEAVAAITEASRRAWKQINALPAGKLFLPWYVRHLMPLIEAVESHDPADLPGSAQDWTAFLANPTPEALDRHRLLREWTTLRTPDRLLLVLVVIERLPYADVALFTGILPGLVPEEVAHLRDRIHRSLRPEEGAA